MKKIKKLTPGGLYLIEGRAVAKNLFFENRTDIELAHRYIERYLVEMVDIIEYVFTPISWTLLIKVKSSKKVEKAYQKRRMLSCKKNRVEKEMEVEAMISEHVRFFLSALVKAINKRTGRTGSKVHSVFQRYIFESQEEYSRTIEELKNANLEIDWKQNKRYRAEISEFNREGLKDRRGEAYINSYNRRLIQEKFGDFDRYLVDLKDFTKVILDEIILVTKCKYFLTKPKIRPFKTG